MTIRLELDRIAPGVEIGPHRHTTEAIVYVAGGELVFEHGESLGRQTVVRAGDVLYEAADELHRVRNDGPADVLALLATIDTEPIAPRILRLAPSADDPVRRGDGARVLHGEGVRHRLLVEPGDFGSVTFTVTEVELDPGVADGWHRHPGSEHALVVFEGRGRVQVGEVEETIEPLAGIRILPGRPHRVINDGRHLLRYYVCASPGTDPLIDRESVDLPPGSDS
jgi:quercetin dioxygenase-like cupin family protein